jgi:hypothetical protein
MLLKPTRVSALTEDEARRLLRDCRGFGGLETWITAEGTKSYKD